MARKQTSQHKKQQRALKKRTKRKQKLVRRRTQESGQDSPRRLLRRARRMPFEGAWVQRGWQEDGEARVLIARTQPSDDLLFAGFVVDYLCTGIRESSYFANVNRETFRNEISSTPVRRRASAHDIGSDCQRDSMGQRRVRQQSGLQTGLQFHRGPVHPSTRGRASHQRHGRVRTQRQARLRSLSQRQPPRHHSQTDRRGRPRWVRLRPRRRNLWQSRGSLPAGRGRRFRCPR